MSEQLRNSSNRYLGVRPLKDLKTIISFLHLVSKKTKQTFIFQLARFIPLLSMNALHSIHKLFCYEFIYGIMGLIIHSNEQIKIRDIYFIK